MGTVTALKHGSKNPQLLGAYRQIIGDAYNHGRTFNRQTVQIMIGFLAATVVAFRMTGDDVWANRFETAGKKLEADWQAYGRVIPGLCSLIDGT